MQHFERSFLKSGKEDIQAAELPESIHIQPESPYEIQYHSALLSWNPLGTFLITYFLTLMQTSMWNFCGSLDS